MSLVFSHTWRHLLHNFSCQLCNRHSSSLLQSPAEGYCSRSQPLLWVSLGTQLGGPCSSQSEKPPSLGFTSTGKRSDLSWKEKWNLWAPSFFLFFFFFFFWFLSVKFLASWLFVMLFYTPSNWPWCWDFNIFLPFWCLELWISTVTHLAGNPVFAGLAHQACGKKVHFHQQIKQWLSVQAAQMPCAADHQWEKQKSELLDSVSSAVISYI